MEIDTKSSVHGGHVLTQNSYILLVELAVTRRWREAKRNVLPFLYDENIPKFI